MASTALTAPPGLLPTRAAPPALGCFLDPACLLSSPGPHPWALVVLCSQPVPGITSLREPAGGRRAASWAHSVAAQRGPCSQPMHSLTVSGLCLPALGLPAWWWPVLSPHGHTVAAWLLTAGRVSRPHPRHGWAVPTRPEHTSVSCVQAVGVATPWSSAPGSPPKCGSTAAAAAARHSHLSSHSLLVSSLRGFNCKDHTHGNTDLKQCNEL